MQYIKSNELLANVLKLLEPMEGIETKDIDNKIIGLYKNNKLFGLVMGLDLYLRTNVNNQIFNVFNENITFQGQEYSKVNKQLFIE